MRRIIAVLGLALFASVVGVAGCSSAGADVAANHDVPYPEMQPCEFADADSLLYLATDGDVAARIAQPFVFDRVDCSGTTAIAYTVPDGVTPPVAMRFEYSIGCWRPVAVEPAANQKPAIPHDPVTTNPTMEEVK